MFRFVLMEVRFNIIKFYLKKFFMESINIEILDYVSWKDSYLGV